MSAVEVWG